MWYAVFDAQSGRLVSVGTSVSDQAELVKKGLSSKELGNDFTRDGKVWDEATASFVPTLVVVPTPRAEKIAQLRSTLESAINLFSEIEP